MMEPETATGTSARDWMKRETEAGAIAFRERFEKVICKEDNIEEVENFMAKSDEHPRFVWLDLLLSTPSKTKSGNDSVETELASLLWIQLIKYFPDVLQRELFLDGFHWISLEETMVDRFGALHGAVLSGRPEIVQLLSEHRKNAELVGNAICLPLRQYLDPGCERNLVPLDCFDSIKRAILWTYLPNPNKYKGVVAFLKAFERAIDCDNIRDLEILMQTFFRNGEEGQASSEPDGATKYHWKSYVWTVILAWACASGRGNIIERFSKSRQYLFQNIKRSPFWKSLFCESPELMYTTERDCTVMKFVNLEVIHRKEKPETRPVVEKIVKIVSRVMAELVEGAQNSETAFIDIVTVYNVSSRVPISQLRPNICNSGWTAIHLAASVGSHAVLVALVKSYDLVLRTFPAEWKIKFQGRDHTTIKSHLQDSLCDTLLMTPLHHAVLGNHLPVVETLLTWKLFHSNVNAVDIFQRTAFQIACSDSSRVSMLQLLLSGVGIDANTKDCCGFTPLHWAVYTGAIDVVRVLASDAKGIRPMSKSGQGQHPYRVAEDLDLVIKKDIQALLESIPEVKHDVERMYRDRQVYVDAANAILVGAAVIASVTFGGWLQLPLGDGQELTHIKVRIYWVFNSLSFFLAIGTVMAGAETVLPQADVYLEDAVESTRMLLVNTAFMFVCSIVFVLGAFASAGFASSSLVNHLNVNMVSTTIIGTIVCSVIGMGFCLRLFKIGKVQWSESLQNTLNRLKQGACFSDTSTHIRKLFRDHFVPTLQESHGGQDQASVQEVRNSCQEVIACGQSNNKLPKKLKEFLHPTSGHPVCPIRRCYKYVELDSKVSDEWLNQNFLPEYTFMWNRILEKLKVLGAASEPRKRTSFFFQGQFTSPSGTEILEREGILRVEKDKELFRRLESLNRQGHKNFSQIFYEGYDPAWVLGPPVETKPKPPAPKPKDKKLPPIELKVPFCCEGCLDSVQAALIQLEGVDSVMLDATSEKMTITGKVNPEDALKEAKKVVKRSEMWQKRKDEGKKDDENKEGDGAGGGVGGGGRKGGAEGGRDGGIDKKEEKKGGAGVGREGSGGGVGGDWKNGSGGGGGGGRKGGAEGGRDGGIGKKEEKKDGAGVGREGSGGGVGGDCGGKKKDGGGGVGGGGGGGEEEGIPPPIELRVTICCEGCISRLYGAIRNIDDVVDVTVDSSTGRVSVTGKAKPEKILKVVKRIKPGAELIAAKKNNNFIPRGPSAE